MNLSTSKVGMEAVCTEVMMEQENRSVAFGRHKICLKNIPDLLGMRICLLTSAASAPCTCYTVSVGQALKMRRWVSCGVMLLLRRSPVRGMSPNNQPRSVFVFVAAILSSLLEESGKVSSLHNSQLHGHPFLWE